MLWPNLIACSVTEAVFGAAVKAGTMAMEVQKTCGRMLCFQSSLPTKGTDSTVTPGVLTPH